MTAASAVASRIVIPTAELTITEVIALHGDNVEAIGREITRVAQGPDNEQTRRALATLRQGQADEAELRELALAGEYPYTTRDPE